MVFYHGENRVLIYLPYFNEGGSGVEGVIYNWCILYITLRRDPHYTNLLLLNS